MTFWDHLDELRGVLVRILLVLVLAGVGAFVAMPSIFEYVVMAPCRADFPTYRAFDALAALFGYEGVGAFDVKVVSLELSTQFFIHMSSTCWTALMFVFPVVLYMLWGFVAPGLHKSEKRYVVPAFLFGVTMFYLGAAVGYYLVFPLALRFLAQYSIGAGIEAMVSLDSYVDNFFMILLMMGAVFELPLVAWLLGKMDLLHRDFFSTYRRHAIVVLLIVAAVVTPTGDPLTLFLAFVPIYSLWELSSRLVPKYKPEAEDAELSLAS